MMPPASTPPDAAASALADLRRAEAAMETMRRAKEAAEAASRAKSDFLANVSHELRTPLNGVLGMAHLLLQDELSPAQRERVRVLKSSADSLLHVLNDLLDFAKMEACKLELNPQPFHLADELGETLNWLALRAHAKGLRLSFYPEPDVPTVVVGDPDRLRQVIINLVGNAIKFTPRGEITVRVRVAAWDEAGPARGTARLEFLVHDTGIGIPADKLGRVFEPFEQADASTTRRYGGTGLGLAIVTRLAALMDGSVSAESRPDVGSTFRFTARFGLSRASSPRAALAVPPRFEGLRVLVADGHPLSRGLLLEQLTAWGTDAQGVAGTAAVAAELARARDAGRPFELLVLDTAVPAADAVAALRRLRAEAGYRGSAVVCVPPDEAGVGALTPGVARSTALVGRPFKPADLLDAALAALRLTPPAWLVGRRSGSTPPVAAHTLRVLLAEDNPVNQAVAVGLLRAVGHTVRVANTGREVLAALKAEPFDVVLMDVQMPEMDGLEATAAIRRGEQGTGRRLPVIALTARSLAEDREECLSRGMDDFVSKPIQPRELYQILNRYQPQPLAPADPPPDTPGPSPAEPAAAGCPSAPEGGVGPAPLDVASLRARCGGRDTLVRQVAKLFLCECPRYLQRLRDALQRADAADLQFAAHALKGATGNLSAAPSAAAARRLEDQARAGRLDAAAEALTALEAELDRLRPALRALLAGSSPAC